MRVNTKSPIVVEFVRILALATTDYMQSKGLDPHSKKDFAKVVQEARRQNKGMGAQIVLDHRPDLGDQLVAHALKHQRTTKKLFEGKCQRELVWKAMQEMNR